MAQTHAGDLPEGFLTQAEVDNADARVESGEFNNRDEALGAIASERGANAGGVDYAREVAAASFPPAGAAPSIGELASMGDPPADAEPESRHEPTAGSEPEDVSADEGVDEPEPPDAEPEPEPESKKGRRG